MHNLGRDIKSEIWDIKKTEKLQDKAIRIIAFKYKNDPSNPLYKSMWKLKLNEVVLFQNCMLVLKKMCNEHPTTFSNFFKISNNEHNHNNRGIEIIKTTVKTTTYGINSIKHKTDDDWNKLPKNYFKF